MTPNQLQQRLNEILPKILSPVFLNGKGIGNEIPFYVFDYPPEDELQVREYLKTLIGHDLKQKLPDRNVVTVNLLEFLLDYVKNRGYFDKLQRVAATPDNKKTLKLIRSITGAEKLADYFDSKIMEQQPDLILISGVGSVYPIIRVHELLNNLHKYTGLTPLIVFCPGEYDKTAFHLLGRTNLTLDSSQSERRHSSRYYRAFRLID
jgi:hypothetical protein